MATAERTERRGISIHPLSEAESFADAKMMRGPALASEAVEAGYVAAVANGLHEGADARFVVRQSPEEGGYSLLHLWFKPNYPLPRHTHDVDCMYYVLAGSAVMGNRTLRAGDAFFVPAGAPYKYSAGPDGAEVLEIRHGETSFDMVILDQPQEQWETMAETARDHKEAWAQMDQSSTTLANRGG